MSRTITALFDTRADADAGAERLRQAGVDASNVAVHDKTTHSKTGADSTNEGKGLWASIKNVVVPKEDRHAYEEGVRRGGFLLTADVDDDKTPAAVHALDDANAVDLDARTSDWRADGWSYGEDAGVGVVDESRLDGTRDPAIGGSAYRSYLPGNPD